MRAIVPVDAVNFRGRKLETPLASGSTGDCLLDIKSEAACWDEMSAPLDDPSIAA